MTQCRAGQVDRALLEAPVGELGHTGIEDGWQHITLDTGDLSEHQQELNGTAVNSVHICDATSLNPSAAVHPPYAELLARSKERVSDPVHYEDVLRFPLDAWRVWESTHPRAYNEHSEVCPCPADVSCRMCVAINSAACYWMIFCGIDTMEAYSQPCQCMC